MSESTVTNIPKPGSKFEFSNERGSFKLGVITSLLIRLIYNRKYDIIDSNMTDSNIALLRSIEGGVLIGIKCEIRSRAFIWSPFDLI